MPLDYTIVGLRIRQERLKQKRTQAELANKMNVSVPFYCRIESGNIHLSLKRLTEICDYLGISQGDILNGASDDSKTYLQEDFVKLLKKCSPEKQKLIFEIAKIIAKKEFRN